MGFSDCHLCSPTVCFGSRELHTRSSQFFCHLRIPLLGGHEDDEFGTEKAIVLWKFNELDKNKDGKLKFKEIRHFKKMVKKLIKPKPCAQEFLNFCDKKPDRTIEKADWTLCLGVDIKRE